MINSRKNSINTKTKLPMAIPNINKHKNSHMWRDPSKGTFEAKNRFFIAPLLKIRFSVPAKRVETAIFNPRVEILELGLQTGVSTRYTGTENQILKAVAMKNSMHYSSLVMQYTIRIIIHSISSWTDLSRGTIRNVVSALF